MNGFMAGRGILMGWVLKKRLATPGYQRQS
jgi:hypothetical protein